MRITLLTCLFVVFGFFDGFTNQEDLKRDYAQAISFYKNGDFRKAIPLLLNVHKSDPNNANVNYVLGNCYLNIAQLIYSCLLQKQ